MSARLGISKAMDKNETLQVAGVKSVEERLHTEYGFDKQLATWAISTLGKALGSNVYPPVA